MPPPTPNARSELEQEFRRALKDCERLYRTSAQECVQNHPQLISGSPAEFVARMLDLHRGLVVKIFVEVARVDRRLSTHEQRLAAALFEHAWAKELSQDGIREAFKHCMKQADDLSWGKLVGPFARLTPLRDAHADLETIFLRIANVVAKIDGETRPDEGEHLKRLQHELQRHLDRPLPLVDPAEGATAGSVQAEAVKQMAVDADQVRRQCGMDKKQARVPKKSREEELSAALGELDGLIGLGNIKQEIHGLVNFLKIQEERTRYELPTTKVSLHMVFRGNPGTGKTTVARFVGRILGAMGVLEKGHLIETDRSGLVAQYAGQTGPKTNKVVDEALDGVLFIDEAYSLVAKGEHDPYGGEAVQALLKRMEDDRARLVVILAGYSEPIDRLLHSNPGLSSRFNRKFMFEDYTAVELGQIFHLMCEKNHYTLPPATRVKLLAGFSYLLARRDEHFGNGRLVRNTFELAIRRLANRLAKVTQLDRKLLTTLEHADISMPDVPGTAWPDADDADRRLQVTCPACGYTSGLLQRYLGKRVRCKRCDHQFRADWGELEAA